MGEDIASLKTNVIAVHGRLDRIEGQLTHLDECIDRLRTDLSFWRGRIWAIGGVMGASVTYILDKVL